MVVVPTSLGSGRWATQIGGTWELWEVNLKIRLGVGPNNSLPYTLLMYSVGGWPKQFLAVHPSNVFGWGLAQTIPCRTPF